MNVRLPSILGATFAVTTIAISAFGASRGQDPRGKSVDLPASKSTPDDVAMWREDEAARERDRLVYRGISVETSPKAIGQARAIQTEIAALMTRIDFVPDHRRAHFQWVGHNGGKITGWDGQIVGVTAVDEGVVVRMRVYPVHTSAATVVNDLVDETYLVADGEIHYLESFTDDSPKITTFN
jgi:hypothetical protein